MGLLQKEKGDMGTWTWKKLKFSKFFTSVSIGKCSSQPHKSREGKGRDWENEELTVGGDQVQDHLTCLSVHKPM